MRAGTAPSPEFPAWWDAQIETLLNGDEDRRSREVRETRRHKRARVRLLLTWTAVAVVTVAITAMSVATGMLSGAAAFVGDFLARIGLT